MWGFIGEKIRKMAKKSTKTQLGSSRQTDSVLKAMHHNLYLIFILHKTVDAKAMSAILSGAVVSEGKTLSRQLEGSLAAKIDGTLL